jgi:hypothetical protein
VVAAVAAAPLLEQEGEDTTVAAVHPGAGSGQRDNGGGQRGGGSSGQQESQTLTHADLICTSRGTEGRYPGSITVILQLHVTKRSSVSFFHGFNSFVEQVWY